MKFKIKSILGQGRLVRFLQLEKLQWQYLHYGKASPNLNGVFPPLNLGLMRISCSKYALRLFYKSIFSVVG